jgi:3-hydroxy-9,10-secoandrosta-1,3,5(10)-triene-9,17-dione monooxygenase
MSGPTQIRTQEVPVPEPDLTPETVIERARALIPHIRDQQDEAERLGHHTAELDRQFVEAGFYRILQPRRFGGYGFGLPTFWRVMLAVSEGDPGTGWGLTLGSHHALVVGAWFSEDGQRDIFAPDGEFRAPHRAPPMGQAQPADGGYVVSGTWDYCSGIAHATHFICNALVAGTTEVIVAVMSRDQVTVLDDWGGGATLGMNASGSNSVRVEEVFVPAHRTVPWDWTRHDTPALGAALHGSPLYCGRIYGVYHAGLVIPVIGAARAALEEYEQIITTKLTYFPPQVPRYTHPDYQRTYGHALALTDAAEAIVLRAGDRYMELAARWAQTGEPFTREDDVRLFTMIQQAGQLAARAVEVIFAAASSSAAKRGTRLQRYYRDVAMYRGHIAAQDLTTAGELARVHFGLPDSLF